MKQVVQNYKSGDLLLEEVPAPALKPGGVLVRNMYSAISLGTEMMKLRNAEMNLLEKAKSRPEEVRKVIQSIKQNGLLSTYKKVMNRLDSFTSLGYSASGIVEKVGSGVEGFKPGDRVAAAGGGYANHAEINFIPQNLCAVVPPDVPLDQASFATIGAIAIQGIRQSKVQFGETVGIIGLGLIGLLAAKILMATGHVVIGVDIDAFKVDFAKKCGIENAAVPDIDDVSALVMSLTRGYGTDAVLIATGTKDNAPIELAAEISRDRGRIVDIGITKMDLPWRSYNEKELEFVFSRSYGPGRYDPVYEEKGIDYPIGFVRWTEKRNIESFLHLIQQGKLDISDLITDRYKFEDAEEIYKKLSAGELKNYIGVIFEYNRTKNQDLLQTKVNLKRKIETDRGEDNIHLGLIGAGNFAKTMLLPHLAKNKKVRLKSAAASTGISAKDTANKFGFESADTSSEDVLTDSEINTVIIATRHNLHAQLVIDGLKNNKYVFVEKPLCMHESELKEISKVYSRLRDEGKKPYLMVGYNRRFSPLSVELKNFFANRKQPLLIHYRVNAGFLPKTNWYQDKDEGGGRIIGEVCHFIDYMTFLTESLPVKVSAMAMRTEDMNIPTRDNLSINLEFADGSVGNIIYTAVGDSLYPKEYVEVFGEQSVGVLNNFSALSLYKDNKKKTKKSHLDKGHKQEMRFLVKSIIGGEGSPISFEEIIGAANAVFKVNEALENNAYADAGIEL
jgi:predicted dehydrogenase